LHPYSKESRAKLAERKVLLLYVAIIFESTSRMVVQALASISDPSLQSTVPKPAKSLLGAMVTRQSLKLHTRRSEVCLSFSDEHEQGIPGFD
jgi:hypothetical protein